MDISDAKSFKAGIVQFDVKAGDVKENVSQALKAVEAFSDQGVNIAVLPEMWTCGFDNQRMKDHARKTPEVLDILARAADKSGMVIAGSMPEASEAGVYNTMYVIDADGSVAGTYRKVHLFRLTEEHKYYAGGKTHVVCRTAVGKIGAMICYDLRFPELCRSMALKGAQTILISAQWPQSRILHWDTLVQARAIENQVFVIAANRCGSSFNLEYGGHSRIISPAGQILAAAENNPCLPTADIDTEEISQFRALIPCISDRVPDAYEC